MFVVGFGVVWVVGWWLVVCGVVVGLGDGWLGVGFGFGVGVGWGWGVGLVWWWVVVLCALLWCCGLWVSNSVLGLGCGCMPLHWLRARRCS
ncbi:hypothetical protein, partial [Pseudomonas syringae group genomosp. 7]|uniref:hypothetical protein n=1 Tax=Pseudomonas syringae group genomosp. 7 TaxID=251699 RepID=UPI00376F8B2B